ncbi:MAG: hypothetical protein ACI90V_003475, partial [Bacillariaceae sp.]
VDIDAVDPVVDGCIKPADDDDDFSVSDDSIFE